MEEETSKDKKKESILVLLEEGEHLFMGRNQVSYNPSIFRSNYLIQSKVCRLIIELGASHNVVSYEVVRKLNLKTFVHPKPYYATWVT